MHAGACAHGVSPNNEPRLKLARSLLSYLSAARLKIKAGAPASPSLPSLPLVFSALPFVSPASGFTIIYLSRLPTKANNWDSAMTINSNTVAVLYSSSISGADRVRKSRKPGRKTGPSRDGGGQLR